MKSLINFRKLFKTSYKVYSTSKRLQAVRTVARGGKFYQLLPDKENTAQSVSINFTHKNNWLLALNKNPEYSVWKLTSQSLS